jgi:hypothetical protein
VTFGISKLSFMTSKYANSPLAFAEAKAFSAAPSFFASRTCRCTVVERVDIVLSTYFCSASASASAVVTLEA